MRVLIIRILLFRLLDEGPLFSETPTWGFCHRRKLSESAGARLQALVGSFAVFPQP